MLQGRINYIKTKSYYANVDIRYRNIVVTLFLGRHVTSTCLVMGLTFYCYVYVLFLFLHIYSASAAYFFFLYLWFISVCRHPCVLHLHSTFMCLYFLISQLGFIISFQATKVFSLNQGKFAFVFLVPARFFSSKTFCWPVLFGKNGWPLAPLGLRLFLVMWLVCLWFSRPCNFPGVARSLFCSLLRSPTNNVPFG